MKRKRKCNVCSGVFESIRVDALYCSSACRQKAKRKNRVCSYSDCGNRLTRGQTKFCSRECQKADTAKRKVDRFKQTSFGLYLLQEVQRAGTIEVLSDLRTYDQLEKMYDLFCKRSLYSGYRQKADYHLCHLYPVKGKLGVGLVSSRNMIIGMAGANRSLGNYEKEGLGVYIKTEDLQECWKLNHDSQVYSLVREYLGSALVTFCGNHQLQPVKEKADGFDVKAYIQHPINVFRSEAKRISKDSRFSKEFRALVCSEASRYSKDKTYTDEVWTQHRDENCWFPWDKEDFDYERDLKPYLEDGSTAQEQLEIDLFMSYYTVLSGDAPFWCTS